MSKQNKKQTYEIVKEPHYICRTPKKFESSSREICVCPHCGNELFDSYSLISIDGKRKRKFYGKECKKCKILFVKQAEPIYNVINDNPYARDITLNGHSFGGNRLSKTFEQNEHNKELKEQENRKKEFIASIRDEQELLSKFDEGIMLVTLQSTESLIKCIITNQEGLSLENDLLITHYANPIALDILTTIYYSPRDIKIDDRNYKVVKVYPRDEFGETKALPETVRPSDVKLKKGGGYYSSNILYGNEVVDILFYSPFTQRFETAHATYSKDTGECLMDINIFRWFVNKYGKPNVKFSFYLSKSANNVFSTDDLNEKSPLREYGYSVSKKEGLGKTEREKILAELVDLKLLSVSDIVNYLNFFIRNHPADIYSDSRKFWVEDIDFISNYKVKPERFLIVKSKIEQNKF